MNSGSDERTRNNVMRHEYRALSEAEKRQMKAVKDLGLDFYELLDRVADEGEGMTRELSLAKTKVEEAVMWAVKDITG